tara:strand:- start:258 stop:566 length:309 start_codon:yes stop_codon:yes gene_type:complete
MENLPAEIVSKVYEYDGRYKNNFNKVIEIINTLNDWYLFTHETLISAIPNNYSSILELPTEDAEYYRSIIKEEFCNYYFKDHNRHFFKKLKPGSTPNKMTMY